MISKLSSAVPDYITPKTLLIGAGAIGALYTARALYHASQLPPGPLGLPLLGRLPWIDANHFEESEEQMRLKYGPIYSYRIGQRLMIVISSHDMMKEMFKDEIFSGRIMPPVVADLSDNCGIIFTEGATWSEQRRVSLRLLRDFGFGKAESVNLINEAVEGILATIERGPLGINSSNLFSNLTNDVIAMLVFGRRYANEDPRYENFLKNAKIFLKDSLSGSLSLMFPSFSWLVKHLPQVQKSKNANLSMHKFFDEEIAKREAELTDINAEPLCVCDAYIQERRRAEARGDFHTHRRFHLVRICLEMFIAGTDTASLSMEWLLAYMALYPNVQSKVQQELDRVVGRNRRPQLADRSELNYTMAVLDESLRLSSLAFNSLTHRAMRDTTFRGFRIPSDAVLVPFVFGLHRDASVWERPTEFYPEHFLDPSGKYKTSKCLIPFSIGKRLCPAESLARIEAFLSFTAILQQYTVQLSEHSRERAAEVERGFTTTPRQPGEHTLDFKLR